MSTTTRPRVPDERDFTSWLRSPAVTARIGVWLGVCFGLAFVTGLVSHWAQIPNPPISVPTSSCLGACTASWANAFHCGLSSRSATRNERTTFIIARAGIALRM